MRKNFSYNNKNKWVFAIFNKYSREYFAIAFFVVFFLIIVSKVFSYTVIEYKYYNELAYKQQVWEVTMPLNRGKIYFSANNPTILWTSVELNDLAIDPNVEWGWDKSKLWIFLRDIVYKQICKSKTKQECYDNILDFLNKLEIKDFQNDEEYIKELIYKNIAQKISERKITSVLIAEELNSEKISLISRLWISWVYLNGDKLYINPEEVTNRNLLSSSLSQILWIGEQDIFYSIRRRDKRFTPIINKLSISVSDEIESFIDDERQSLRANILDESETISNFIILKPHPHRSYPEKNNASQVIGFLSRAWFGQYGIEWYFDDLLRWKDKQVLSKKDSLWRTIDTIWDWVDKISWQWADIYITVDRSVQKNVERILEKWVKDYRAIKWSVVVMEPNTWEIIAMANYPSFDLNNPWSVYEIEKVNYMKYTRPEVDLLWIPVFVEDREKGKKYYYDSKEIFLREIDRDELSDYGLEKYKFKNDFWNWVYKNDIISSSYEPWSIMKAITVAIWIDTEEIKRYDMYMDKMKVTIDGFTIANVSGKCEWYHSFAHALNYSCNLWMLEIVKRVGKVIMHDYLESFGFWRKTGISLEGEVFSKITPYEKWSKAKLLTSSFWMWVSVTPLQMATAYSVIANGWVYVKPNIIKKVVYPDGREVKYKKEVTHRVIQESTSEVVSSMLLDTVNNWVAFNWAVEWYNIAWKTWTSQIPYKWEYEEWEWSTWASFAGFWPYEEPKFVVIVKLERPKTSIYWWVTAAPVFSEIAEYLFNYYGIPKSSERDRMGID